MLKKGLVQIYTGSGKGKTTAALGLALRGAGWGKKVVIYQFLKPPALKLGERKAVAKTKLPIKIVPLETEWDMRKSLSDKKNFENTKKKIGQICDKIAVEAKKRKYDIIILDEIVFCLSKKLANIKWIKNIIKSKAEPVEIVLTGRGANAELIKLADLVTETKEIKHPFKKGIKARKGIEF
ncbi:MAG: cob(I)yrinic acid a,c-diamide adenosyltransferase [Planctomycetes bacterium]|nr:cob(I)yrinic acid a,c-diamide adenosyltransferase [Planctomycetota bacterium]MBU1518454.1 cob(I)yrinic acid a,c-diamide adenosyltransferase [Planctomycetota bacterium]MBU2458028.1 cob(I)yrinic acid a,c-diamide adenosyltransferase [Planctomycetota bacterium]MBU2596502.1 cob(I)yrinic acid a,c-diamide adenosyltransferase [Planctomycetota bacterium]